MKNKFIKAPKQPSPDEIIDKYFTTHSLDVVFTEGSNLDCLTQEGKGLLALGITIVDAFNKKKN